MALTAQQRADIRLYLGWSARFGQFDSALERAMDALDTYPEHALQITNALTDDPPGLLALLKKVDADLLVARGRYKADKVGSIELNRGEASQIRRDGKEFVNRLASILAIEPRSDVFGSSRRSNFVGK